MQSMLFISLVSQGEVGSQFVACVAVIPSGAVAMIRFRTE
jgi:hypothetical protein